MTAEEVWEPPLGSYCAICGWDPVDAPRDEIPKEVGDPELGRHFKCPKCGAVLR